MSEEIWRPIAGYERLYEVSNLGRVRSLRITFGSADKARAEPRVLKPSPGRGGYLKVTLSRRNKPKQRSVHHLVLEAFVGPRPAGHEAAHLDGNPANPAASNLVWATHQENLGHKRLHGTHQSGEQIANAKLTNAQVAEIKRELSAGRRPQHIARQFGVARQTISSIKHGRRYRHIPAAAIVERVREGR